MELLESLCELWSQHLAYPDALDSRITGAYGHHSDVGTHLLSRLLRCAALAPAILARENVRKFIRDTVQQFRERESMVLMRFENMGWLLRHSEQPDEDVKQLRALLLQVEQRSRERCCRCVCALYRACGDESKCGRLASSFALPARMADSHKPDCLELFLERLPRIEDEKLEAEVTLLGLETLLRSRVAGCEEPGLKIVKLLVGRLRAERLRPFLELAKGFMGPGKCFGD